MFRPPLRSAVSLPENAYRIRAERQPLLPTNPLSIERADRSWSRPAEQTRPPAIVAKPETAEQ